MSLEEGSHSVTSNSVSQKSVQASVPPRTPICQSFGALPTPLRLSELHSPCVGSAWAPDTWATRGQGPRLPCPSHTRPLSPDTLGYLPVQTIGRTHSPMWVLPRGHFTSSLWPLVSTGLACGTGRTLSALTSGRGGMMILTTKEGSGAGKILDSSVLETSYAFVEILPPLLVWN